MLVFEYMQCVSRLWVIVSYVPYVFLILLLQISTSLSNICLFTCVTGECVYRVSHELRSLLRESVPYVKIYRYNPKHLCPKLNGYGDNGHRKVWASGVSTYCRPSVTPYSFTAHARQRDVLMQ